MTTTTKTKTYTTNRTTTESTGKLESAPSTKIDDSVAQIDIGDEPENSNGFDVSNLESELKEGLQITIQELYEEQEKAHAVDNERVSALGLLENAHQELKGEHIQDLEDGKRLQQASDDIDNSIVQNKANINDEISQIQESIKVVDTQTDEAKQQINTLTNENNELQSTIDTPEDLKEQGFSQEAKDIRKENEDLKSKIDTETDALVKQSNERDSLLDQHSEEVKNYNDTVYKYYNLLLKAEQARKIYQDSLNEVQEKVSDLDKDNIRNEQMVQINEINVDVLGQTVESLRKDLNSSSEIYNDHINELIKIIASQNREINSLKNQFNDVGSNIKYMQTEVEKQKVAVAAYEKDMGDIKAIGYNDKINKLQSDLKRADDVRQKSQDDLENLQDNWTTKIKLFDGQDADRKRERDQRLADVSDNIKKIQQAQDTIVQLMKDLDTLHSKKISDDNKDKVQTALDSEIQNTNFKLRWATEERDNAAKDLEEAIRLAKEKDEEISEQEKKIKELLDTYNELNKHLEEKKNIIAALENDIQLADEEIESHKKTIEALDSKIDLLKVQIRDRDDQILEMERELATKDLRTQQLFQALNEVPPPVPDYKAVRGDEVDEMLAQYLRDCPVPVKRLGDGFYLFGTRKIYAKILNGKLVVRVGGGYMFISEFIATYSGQEIIKLTKICEQYGVDSIWDLDLEEIYHSKSPGGRNSPRGSPRGEQSPNFNKSKKGKTFKSSLNGTKRQKQFNATAIVRRLE